MKNIILCNTKNPQSELCVQIADTFFSRLRGLMLRKKEDFPLGRGLLIAPCSSIHTMFMLFSIDVVYIDKEYRVLKVVENVRPWLDLSACFSRKTWGVLELPVGSVHKYKLNVGDVLTSPTQLHHRCQS